MRKILLILLVLVASSAVAQTTVRCESVNNRMNDCEVGTGFVTLARQLSDNDCVHGTSWGYDNGKIWVKEGCRAEFHFSERAMVTCESREGQPGHCFADTSEGVRLVRRISDSKCQFGRDWGWDTSGIWVTNGCRGEFAVRPAGRVATITTSTEHGHGHGHGHGTMVSSTAARPATILCESKNNTRSHCRTDTRWGITLVRQVSDNDCIRGRSWGWDSEGIWVTDGCRGEFTLGENVIETPLVSTQPIVVTQPVVVQQQPVIVQPAAPQVVAVPTQERLPTVMCESVDGRRNHCAVTTTNGVRLLRQTSEANCVFNSTWGVDGNGIWVTNGCRGEFALGGANNADPRVSRVLCESKNGQRAVCPADTRMGIAVVRQVSDAPCTLNSTWGYDTEGIWVTSGCRAEFILRR